MIFIKCQNYTVSCDNQILFEEVFMILYDLLGEKAMTVDNSGNVKLYELQ
jgi:hypothetical protein